MRELFAGGRGRLWTGALLSAATSGCGIALMGCAAWLLSRAAEHPSASALALVAVAVRALGLSRGLARYAERLVGHDATLRVVADLRVDVFRALAQSGAPTRTGEVLSTVVADVEAVQDLWLRCLVPAAAAALVTGATVLAVLWWSTAAALVLLSGLSCALLIVPALAAVAATKEHSLAAQRSGLQVQVLDVLHGCAELTVLGALPSALDAADRAAAVLARVDRRAGLRAGALTAVSGVVQAATVLGVLAVALPAVRTGALPRVDLAVLVLVALASFELMAPLVEAGALLPRTWGALQRLSAARAVPVRPQVADVPAGGAVRLRGVEASYGRGAVLRDVDLDLGPGRCVVVTGPSGSGKTTLLQVLSGALVPDRGQALVDGTEVSSLDDVQRSRHVVLAEQEAFLFAATLRDNLRVARPEASDDVLLQALRDVGLDAWFGQLPRGWDTPVGERGSQVSGGERTR
ncbi:MAG: thiol reductant ABC exporter subunit CydC, partial [Pseudorhodobacter sp.]|nr:thiol reductant ABC exporter subunit CydC [Frankiaceae bacterium]